MAAPVTNNEDQREQRLADVARLYCHGKAQWEIGKELGVTQQQICYDLKIVRQRWLESSLRDFDEARAQEIAKIDDAEREFRAAWERSKRPRKSKEGTAVNTEDEPGDPRFMEGYLKCTHMRCELLGLNAAKKIALMDGDGNYGPFLTEDDRRNRLLAAFVEQGAAGEPGPTVM